MFEFEVKYHLFARMSEITSALLASSFNMNGFGECYVDMTPNKTLLPILAETTTSTPTNKQVRSQRSVENMDMESPANSQSSVKQEGSEFVVKKLTRKGLALEKAKVEPSLTSTELARVKGELTSIKEELEKTID